MSPAERRSAGDAGEDAGVAGAAAVAETHSAVVFFFGDRAYKVKKPVDLGFLDFSTVEARRVACEREVALNRRLAPDVYLGVAVLLDPDGAPGEPMVVMRRLPDGRRLRACLERGESVTSALHDVARQLATLHSAPSLPERTSVATAASVRTLWTDGFETLAAHPSNDLDPALQRRVESLALRYLDGRAALFDHRIATGQVRDGHGDLQAEDVFVLDDGPRILDCLEFDDELRWGDVLLDVGFLAMDLERLGHPDLASGFLADYRERSGRSWPPSLAHHYLAYRAFVRAKVAVLRDEQTGRRSLDAAALQRQCASHLEAGRIRLVLVGGAPGTGKSTVAAALGDATGSVVLRTDAVRRQGPVRADRYSPSAIEDTYRRMLDEAEQQLALGAHVILDATWSDAAHRALARRAADKAAADLVEVRCTAPLEVCRSRISRRRAEGRDPSEATPEIAAEIAQRFEPWPEAHVVDTDRDLERVLDEALAACRWERPLRAI